MADKELAAKLAKRLACTEQEEEPSTASFAPPLPCPDIPTKIIENPFVAVDNSFSIDDLVLKTLELQALAPEENNNSQKSLNPVPAASPVSSAISPISGPTSPSSSAVPPRTTIRDLLLRDKPQEVKAVPKNPVVSVEHHKRGQEELKKKSPEIDGSELERKLAAQRAKKEHAEEQPASVSDRKDSFEELEAQMQREVEEEERIKADATAKLQEAPKPVEEPVKVEEEKKELKEGEEKVKKAIVPSPLLMEAIQKECGGIKSPPPPTRPKPQTPTHSRPQSPVVFNIPQSPAPKKILSPLGLTCDPLMSIEPPTSPKAPQSPKAVKKVEENPEELAALLERRNKINEGEEVPQFVNRKLSIYAEFSEFSRKQIKFFSDTFKKFDEDCDGFIDFNELKRMMERLGEAQTHIALKEIIKKVDEDLDGKINMREFLLLFRLAANGELECSEVFTQLAGSVDVAKEGVLAAASFFQAKIAEQTKGSKFEEEIKQEQEERRREEEERKQRREQFLQKKSIFH